MTSDRWVEIETRLKFIDSSLMQEWIEKHAIKVSRMGQVDIYFQPKEKPFLDKGKYGDNFADKWLRVRETDKLVEFCFKHNHRDTETGRSIFADEVEVEVSDKEAIIKILQNLDYQIIAQVKKTRTSWIYGNFKIDVDDVEGLGRFFEIEYKEQVSDPVVGRENLLKFINENIPSGWRVIDKAYPVMIWEKKIS